MSVFTKKFKKAAPSQNASSSAVAAQEAETVKRALAPRAGTHKTAEQLLEEYGEYMIEHSSLVGSSKQPGTDSDADEESYVLLGHSTPPDSPSFSNPQTPDAFADDYVENTRAITAAESDYHVYGRGAAGMHKAPPAVIRHGGISARDGDESDAAETLRREFASQGLEVPVNDLDVLFDMDEELEKLVTARDPAPVVRVPRNAIVGQFQELMAWRDGEAEKEGARGDVQSLPSETGTSGVMMAGPSANVMNLADSDSGYITLVPGAECINALDVQRWDVDTREYFVNLYQDEETVEALDARNGRVASSNIPQQDLRVDTGVENPVLEPSELLTRRYLNWHATNQVPALYRRDEDDAFLNFEDVDLSGYSPPESPVPISTSWANREELFLEGPLLNVDNPNAEHTEPAVDINEISWYNADAEVDENELFFKINGAHTVEFCPSFERPKTPGEQSDVDRLMTPEEEQEAFSIKRGAYGANDSADIADAHSRQTCKVERAHAKKCKTTKEAYPSRDITEMAISQPHDEPQGQPPSMTYYSANVHGQVPYTALNELYTSTDRNSEPEALHRGEDDDEDLFLEFEDMSLDEDALTSAFSSQLADLLRPVQVVHAGNALYAKEITFDVIDSIRDICDAMETMTELYVAAIKPGNSAVLREYREQISIEASRCRARLRDSSSRFAHMVDSLSRDAYKIYGIFLLLNGNVLREWGAERRSWFAFVKDALEAWRSHLQTPLEESLYAPTKWLT